jgi:hypothetical protein
MNEIATWIPIIGGGLTTLAGWVFFAGRTAQRITALESRMKSVETNGSTFAQTTRLIVDMHSEDIRELKAEQKKMSETLTEIKGDIKTLLERTARKS